MTVQGMLEKTDDDYSKLLVRRFEVSKKRNDLAEKPFFFLRPNLKRLVAKLDAQLSSLDRRITALRNLLMGRKVVRTSNSALRFYRRDGWIREVLEVYLCHGQLLDSHEVFGDCLQDAYFMFAWGSKVDVKSLYLVEVSQVDRCCDDDATETDLEFLERMACLC